MRCSWAGRCTFFRRSPATSSTSASGPGVLVRRKRSARSHGGTVGAPAADAPRGPHTVLGGGGFGAATIIFGLSQWFWLSLAMMFLIGALDNISVVVRHTLVQMLTPDEMRGGVSAVNSVFIVASNDIGGLESGVTAWMFGLVRSVVVGGVGSILVVLAASRIWPQILLDRLAEGDWGRGNGPGRAGCGRGTGGEGRLTQCPRPL